MMELVTLKGKYRVGEAVELCLRVEDETADTAEITVWHLARALYCQSVAVRGKETIFALPPFDMPGACYGVEGADDKERHGDWVRGHCRKHSRRRGTIRVFERFSS